MYINWPLSYPFRSLKSIPVPPGLEERPGHPRLVGQLRGGCSTAGQFYLDNDNCDLKSHKNLRLDKTD